MTTDEEALAATMNVLERLVTLALDGFKHDIDPDWALSEINNLGRNTIDALAARRLSPPVIDAPQDSTERDPSVMPDSAGGEPSLAVTSRHQGGSA